MMRPPVPVGHGVVPSDLCLDADVTRCGRVALRVLYEPRTSMSMTDLNAFVLSWFIGARKLPAAPALKFPRQRRPSDSSFRQLTLQSQSFRALGRIVRQHFASYLCSEHPQIRCRGLWRRAWLLRCLSPFARSFRLVVLRCRHWRRGGRVL